MAGDWIKFELATSDKPEIWEIAATLNIDPDAVVGKMIRVWSWFNLHTEKGNAPCVTKTLLDRNVGVTGFCDAVVASGWMSEIDGQITLPNFLRHNGNTAKNRAMTAIRAATRREKAKQKSNAPTVTTALPREEKRREDNNKNNTSNSMFDAFWNAYPKKVEKKKSLEIWKRKKLAQKADIILNDIVNRADKDKQWLEGFIPNPTTYLNGERWEDEITLVTQNNSGAHHANSSGGSKRFQTGADILAEGCAGAFDP